MRATIRELADLVGGELAGDGTTPINAAEPLRDAGPGCITLALDHRHLEKLRSTSAAGAVVPQVADVNALPVIRCADPLAAFARIVLHFKAPVARSAPAIHATACVDPTARIGRNVFIDPFVVVGPGSEIGDGCCLKAGVVVGANCRLGREVVLHPHAVLYDETILGDRCIVHAHAVIGADGFGYRRRDGVNAKIPQLGRVEVGEDVEIGAGSAIDRATFGSTRIGAGTKIDNLVQVGHNCRIGQRNLLCAQAGVAGSTDTGDDVILGGQAGVTDHVTIGPGAIVAGKSGVIDDVPAGQHVFGYPARPMGTQGRIWLALDHLPAMRKTLKLILHKLGMQEPRS